MESYSKISHNELNYLINKAKEEHDAVKDEITRYTLQIEEFEKIVNEKLEILTQIEKHYVDLMKELSERQ